MAEVKNAFIKSKMNKDLDARLIPQGEYRDAVNIQVSKSEGDDVGALENVLGNVSRAEFEVDSGVSNLTCIGYFASESNSAVYLFFTDYTDPYNTPTPTYSPSANNFIYQCDLSSNPNPTTPATITKLVEGAFLNFSTNRPVIGVNLLEEFLFFTDNRNQPRKINVNLANPNESPTPTYYTTEDNISIAKYYPYEPILLIKESALSPGDDECAMYDAFSEFIPLNQGSAGVPTAPNVTNPYYNSNFPGDPRFLEDKFVRFSYRFKFVDGEYSLIAPFTQPCFIPKQDGYFLEGDEEQTFASTIVGFMENKVNKIDLQIPLPSTADNLSNDFHVAEIDIIYKESDALALQVVETIPIIDITGTDSVFEYTYLSQKPYKTLPENEITRVYDKIPVKALGQEVISNRVVYSNFQDKHTPPNFIKYQVGANEKYLPTDTTPYPAGRSKTTIEYPNQTLKQNRNYQVGVVLSDRYGRQSTVILSNDQNPSAGGFGADTIYLPYRDVNDSVTYLGDSLKLSFNDPIQSNKNESFLTPGLYSSDSNDPGYNPLGWQTFKIVVKQIQQEYYNVYSAGAMKDVPYDYDTSSPPSVGNEVSPNTSFITLINDNINKVPRDLTEIGPQDKSFRSSVVLFGRVDNTTNNFSNTGNKQYIPTNERLSFTTNVIEDLFDLFDVLQFLDNSGNVVPITSPENAYHGFYKSDSNPFISEFITTQTTADQFGVFNQDTGGGTSDFKDIENLAVFETAPTVSRLDLYYETSTTGLVEDLNAAVGSQSGGATSIGSFSYFQDESFQVGDAVASGFEFLNFGNVALTGTAVLVSAITDSGSNVTNKFSLVSLSGTEWELRTNAFFYYGANSGVNESYTFTFEFTVGTTVTTLPSESGNLENINPTINNSNANPIQKEIGDQSVLLNLSGVNGSNPSGGQSTAGLTFSIDSSTGAGTYVVVNNNEVQNTDTSAAGSGTFTLRLTDAGSPQVGTVTKTFNVNFDEATSNFPQISTTQFINDGSGGAWYFTSNYTGLVNNIPSTTFNSPSYNSNGYNTNKYLIGLDSNLSTTSNTRSVCNPNNAASNPFPTAPPAFYNLRPSNAQGLTAGTFYIYINPYNEHQRINFGDSQTNLRYQIAYRANSSSAWTTAIDVNGQSASQSGTWRYDGSREGYFATTVFSPWSNSALPSITIQKEESNTNRRYAGLVYAFNTPGEYRILHGNYTSSFGSFTINSFPASGFSCTQPPYTSTEMSSYVEYGDFYYPSSNAGGTNDEIGPGSGDTNTVYRYQIMQSSCTSSFSGINVYAREPVAKYVTQVYTNLSLTTKYGTSTSGTPYLLRRMESLGTSGGNNVLNPEYTRNGAYQVFFQNTTGLVNPGSQSLCLYP